MRGNRIHKYTVRGVSFLLPQHSFAPPPEDYATNFVLAAAFGIGGLKAAAICIARRLLRYNFSADPLRWTEDPAKITAKLWNRIDPVSLAAVTSTTTLPGVERLRVRQLSDDAPAPQRRRTDEPQVCAFKGPSADLGRHSRCKETRPKPLHVSAAVWTTSAVWATALKTAQGQGWGKLLDISNPEVTPASGAVSSHNTTHTC